MAKLNELSYMGFPFRVGPGGVRTSDRARHVRETIEQVLFTNPGERVYRPEFGAGIRALIFEPNTGALAEVTRKRMASALSEVLLGEVDRKTLDIDVTADPAGGGEALLVTISYTLATIGETQRHEFLIGSAGDSHG